MGKRVDCVLKRLKPTYDEAKVNLGAAFLVPTSRVWYRG